MTVSHQVYSVFTRKFSLNKKMGKYNKNMKKRGRVGLEIVPKEQEAEVQLPESRKSDDKPLKKVNSVINQNPCWFVNVFIFCDFRRNG